MKLLPSILPLVELLIKIKGKEKIMRKVKQIIQLVLMVNGLLLAETLEVGGSGSYSKIQSAIDAASNGDTIKVNSGTYIESLNILKSLTIIGQGYNNTLIYNSDYGIKIKVDNKSVNISGFNIESTSKQAVYTQGSSLNIVFKKCVFKSSMSSGPTSEIGAVYIVNYSGTEVNFNNCVFENSYAGICVHGRDGNSNVKNSIFYSNANRSVNVNSGNIAVTNSIVYGNGNTLYRDSESTLTSAYNIFYSNTSTLAYNHGSLGILESDPKFVDISNGYSLASDSPCINAGNPSSTNNDPDGTRNDIGVYGGLNTWSAGPAVTALSISSASVEQGTSITITATAKSK